MRTDLYIVIFILAIMVAAFVSASFFPYRQAKLAPLTVSGIVLILAAVQLGREVRSRKERSGSRQEGEKADSGDSLRRYFLEGTWMAGFIAGIYLFGFLVAIPLFGIAYMKRHGATWSTSIMLAALMTIFSWGIFSYLLEVKFYPGFIPNLLKLTY